MSDDRTREERLARLRELCAGEFDASGKTVSSNHKATRKANQLCRQAQGRTGLTRRVQGTEDIRVTLVFLGHPGRKAWTLPRKRQSSTLSYMRPAGIRR